MPGDGLRETIATPEGKQRYVRQLFATIADQYDFITRFLSFGQDRRWKRQLVRLAAVQPSDRVLDLACGTGDILFEAMRFGPRRGVGLDLTFRMVRIASRRRDGAAFCVGDMLALPFNSGDADVVTTGYGLRNVPHLDVAIREIHRVLAPGGRLLSLDFNRPDHRIVRAVYLAYLTAVGSMLGLALHRDPDTYRYIPESIRNYPGAAGVARMLAEEGFIDVRVVPVLFGLMAIHVATKR